MSEAKSKGGRPKFDMEEKKFTAWEQLDSLIIWASQEYCAEQLGISVDTLMRNIKSRTGLSFAEYKHQKKEVVRINLFKKQYEVAMRGNVAMLIFLGKNELGQSDKLETKNKHEIDSQKAVPKMTKEEKLQMLERYKEKLTRNDEN